MVLGHSRFPICLSSLDGDDFRSFGHLHFTRIQHSIYPRLAKHVNLVNYVPKGMVTDTREIFPKD
jgi:hypothetical protein